MRKIVWVVLCTAFPCVYVCKSNTSRVNSNRIRFNQMGDRLRQSQVSTFEWRSKIKKAFMICCVCRFSSLFILLLSYLIVFVVSLLSFFANSWCHCLCIHYLQLQRFFYEKKKCTKKKQITNKNPMYGLYILLVKKTPWLAIRTFATVLHSSYAFYKI